MNPSPNRSSQMPNSSSSHPTQSSEQVVDMPKDLQMSAKQVHERSDIEQSTSPPSSVSETVSEITSDTSVSTDLSDTSDTSDSEDQLLDGANRFWQHPIPPPSEPRQYRAIGLIRGRYTASQDQFTQGILLTSDGTVIDAVLLGRVMSLVKKHLDLEQEHLWVVYPRTRQQEGNLHVQIMGVWEPETLKKEEESTTELAESSESSVEEAASIELAESSESSVEELTESSESVAVELTAIESAESSESSESSVEELTESSESVAVEPSEPPIPPAPLEVEHGYFSVRGEVVYQSQEQEKYVIIKIRQSSRSEKDKPKFFKLKLDGLASPKVVGHFLDLHVQLKQDCLVIQESHDIGMIAQRGRPPRKPFRGNNRNPRRPGGPSRGSRPPFKSKPNFSQNRPEPLSKPVKPKPKTEKE